MSEETNNTPPFALTSTVTVSFTAAQLMDIALEKLAEAGHEFDPATVKSTFNTKGLELTIQTSEGKPAPKKRKAAKKVTKKVEKPTEKPEEKVVEETETVVDAKSETVDGSETTEAVGDNPFQASNPVADSNEDTIAEVKKEAGVEPDAPFSTDTTEIAESDSGEAATFRFDDIG